MRQCAKIEYCYLFQAIRKYPPSWLCLVVEPGDDPLHVEGVDGVERDEAAVRAQGGEEIPEVERLRVSGPDCRGGVVESLGLGHVSDLPAGGRQAAGVEDGGLEGGGQVRSGPQ